MSTKLARNAAAVMAAAFAAALIPLSSAAAGPVGGKPGGTASASTGAVDVVPADTSGNGPNQGQWFVFALAGGQSKSSRAMLINPADHAQSVTLSARQVNFSANGTPSLDQNPATGVGTWVSFSRSQVTVPARAQVLVPFQVAVPANPEPGDHTGAIVATSQPQQAGSYLVTRVIATRFYVTVPGKAVVGFRLDHAVHHLDNPLWPHSGTASVTVVNTGNVRFVPDVRLDGATMTGSNLVMAQSIERYAAPIHVPWYGGRVTLHFSATANGGSRQQLSQRFWVIPWTLIALVLIGAGALTHLIGFARRRWRRSRAEQLALRQRLAELEQATAAVQGAAPQESREASLR